jgi:type IV pilus assembly protein PilV
MIAKGARGYTVIEVMIALTLLAIGTSGIIAMEKVTSVTNREAKNLVIANQIARTWMERLRADAVQWNNPSAFDPNSDISDTLWLNQITNNPGVWFRPAYDANRGSPGADAFGNDVTLLAMDTASFCTNIRLSWLYGPPGVNAPPPYLIRAEVRVYWLRDGGPGGVDPTKSVCDASINLDLVSPAVTNYHFVYLTSGITQNLNQ